MNSAKQLCTFHLGDLFLGVHVHEVQEVIRSQEMTDIPLAPKAVRGLINLRGQIVTAIDLRRRFGLPDRTDDEPPMNVVVRTPDGIVSLLVDQIGDVIQIDDARFEHTPPNLTARERELVSGVFKLDASLLLVLNTETAVALETAPDRVHATVV